MKKNWKKVLPIALLAASAFFTFGASLGLTAGWASKVGALVSKIGLQGKMANVLAGAITQAGYGAAVGGVTGALTGQGFMKGASAGAAIGAVTGGVTGAFRPTMPTAGAPGQPGAGSSPLMAGAEATTASDSTILAQGGAVAQQSTFGRVWNGVVGSGGIGPIVQGVGAGLARGVEQRRQRSDDDDRQQSYDVEYRPVKPLFERAGNRITVPSLGS